MHKRLWARILTLKDHLCNLLGCDEPNSWKVTYNLNFDRLMLNSSNDCGHQKQAWFNYYCLSVYCLRCRLEEAPSDDCFLKHIILISPVFGAAMTIDAQDIWILLSEGVSDYFTWSKNQMSKIQNKIMLGNRSLLENHKEISFLVDCKEFEFSSYLCFSKLHKHYSLIIFQLIWRSPDFVCWIRTIFRIN